MTTSSSRAEDGFTIATRLAGGVAAVVLFTVYPVRTLLAGGVAYVVWRRATRTLPAKRLPPALPPHSSSPSSSSSSSSTTKTTEEPPSHASILPRDPNAWIESIRDPRYRKK